MDKHKSYKTKTGRKQICENCKWWHYDRRHMTGLEGYCHRYPPTARWSDYQGSDGFFFGWGSMPVQSEGSDWCGEWGKK